jgi:hypothetical protein
VHSHTSILLFIKIYIYIRGNRNNSIEIKGESEADSFAQRSLSVSALQTSVVSQLEKENLVRVYHRGWRECNSVVKLASALLPLSGAHPSPSGRKESTSQDWHCSHTESVFLLAPEMRIEQLFIFSQWKPCLYVGLVSTQQSNFGLQMNK